VAHPAKTISIILIQRPSPPLNPGRGGGGVQGGVEGRVRGVGEVEEGPDRKEREVREGVGE